jgi:hypothetical protein
MNVGPAGERASVRGIRVSALGLMSRGRNVQALGCSHA